MRIQRTPESGNAVIEVSFMLPWLFFLFVGIFDFGFYAYSAIATENAARVAALHVSSDASIASDAVLSSQIALADACNELVSLPNVGTSCPSSVVTVSVPTQPFLGADGQPAVQVTVTYATTPLIPIPGLLTGQMTLSRTVQVRI